MEQKNSIIEHDGTVKSIENGAVTVKIISASACSGCHAKGVCSLSEMKEKTVIVPGMYNVNQGNSVIIRMKRSMGYKALLLGYIFPMILFIAALVVLGLVSKSEITTGLGAIAVLVLYYIILRFFRKTIDSKFTFTLKV
ncbi:MAG TPA: SoxR reducing system RseC family protein [Bacteroidales bacterium]|nr:SoxR reducing system RseC family protein [Bacteroidales bacterium]HPR72778.1 SoxR reducing system RseC family protein [Bacteroidales bacterium]